MQSSGGISSPNKLIDLPLLNITARCTVNSNCALVIGVGLAPLGPSIYNLTYLPARTKLSLISSLTDTIRDSQIASFEVSKTFWFTIPYRLTNRLVTSVFNWTQLILVGGGDQTEMKDVD